MNFAEVTGIQGWFKAWCAYFKQKGGSQCYHMGRRFCARGEVWASGMGFLKGPECLTQDASPLSAGLPKHIPRSPSSGHLVCGGWQGMPGRGSEEGTL